MNREADIALVTFRALIRKSINALLPNNKVNVAKYLYHGRDC